jgi:HD-GYP domain-containing protein (c-di-GMP phosphodiesterase class II)
MTPQQKESFDEFVRNIAKAASAMSLYGVQHKLAVSKASQSLVNLNDSLKDDSTVTVMHLGNDLFVNGLPLEKGPHPDRLMRAMKDYGMDHITICRGATYDEIALLIRIVAQQAARDLQPTPHLRFGKVSVDMPRQSESEALELSSFSDIPSQYINQLDTIFSVHDSHEPLDMSSVLSLVAGFVTAFRKEANPLLALAPLREMDEYTFTHSLNLCILNLAQGMSLGFEGQLLHDIGIAALLHDVGKQFVPEEILNKPGKLQEDEWELMRQHAIRGAEYLLNNPGVPRMAILCAFEHHMKYDMTGYPKVPKGWQTNLCSQITMVSDIFDALRTKRVYRNALDFDEVAGIMLWMAGTDLNPTLTLNFLRILRKLEEL